MGASDGEWTQTRPQGPPPLTKEFGIMEVDRGK